MRISMLFQMVSAFCTLLTTVCLPYWSESKFKNKHESFFIGIYILLTFSSAIFTFCASFTTFIFTLTAFKNIHNSTAYRILDAPMSYIDTTLIDTILNRFFKDVDTLDSELRFQKV